MQLKEIQQTLAQVSKGPASAQEALKELKACVSKSLDYLQEGNIVQAQVFLEHAFTQMMICFHYLNLDGEKVAAREKSRQENKNPRHPERVILVFSDHAELRVGGELRGTIPLYSSDDYKELRQIAHLFECRLEHADHLQLNLLSLLGERTTS